ncbi:MAG: hypothetical protein ACPGNT_09080, partial [Rhodospirillales bacterium]
MQDDPVPFGKSLSAKIILGVVVIVVVLSAANLIIGAIGSGRVDSRTQDLVSAMQAALAGKDSRVNELLNSNLTQEEDRLAAEQQLQAHEALAKAEEKTSFLAGERFGISHSAITQIRAAMMLGEAQKTVDLM